MISIPAAAGEDGKFSSTPPTTYTKKKGKKRAWIFNNHEFSKLNILIINDLHLPL
jgi:hypothetical protein